MGDHYYKSDDPPPFEDTNYSGGINLSKDSEPAPPPYVEASPSDRGATPPPAQHNQPPRQHVVQQNQSSSGAVAFHCISICCALLSIFLSPLIEIIPMCLFCCFAPALRDRNNLVLHSVDLTVTMVAFVIWLVFVIIIAVLTFGIGLILLIFLIPYVIVLTQLAAIS